MSEVVFAEAPKKTVAKSAKPEQWVGHNNVVWQSVVQETLIQNQHYAKARQISDGTDNLECGTKWAFLDVRLVSWNHVATVIFLCHFFSEEMQRTWVCLVHEAPRQSIGPGNAKEEAHNMRVR